LDFLKLKTELQDEVINFIEKGSHIMTKWAEINIHLLTRDRCTDILSKALQILDGVTSFYTEIIGTPIWPSVPTTHINLFLFKLYLSNALIDITDIIDYLNVPSENILLIATRILTNLTTDEEANELISSFNLSDIDLDDEQQLSIIRETLTSFDQILRLSTIYVWEARTDKLKLSTAATNLESKMMGIETINATESTALAIYRVTRNLTILTSST
jgi:hypothetical protein